MLKFEKILKEIEEIVNISDEELEKKIINAHGFLSSVSFEEMIVYLIINAKQEDFGVHYKLYIASLFNHLRKPAYFFVYKDENYFSKNGYFKMIETMDLKDVYEHLIDKNKTVIDSYFKLCYKAYSTTDFDTLSFVRQRKALLKEDKEKIIDRIISTKNEKRNWFSYRNFENKIITLKDFCSSEDLELLELNYEDSGNAYYELIFKHNPIYFKLYTSNFEIGELKLFIEELNEIGILMDFDLKNYLLKNFDHLSI